MDVTSTKNEFKKRINKNKNLMKGKDECRFKKMLTIPSKLLSQSVTTIRLLDQLA